jgi:uncharacterized protein YcaQ
MTHGERLSSAVGDRGVTDLTISQDVLRRYVLCRQGLWPGRRWVGKEGADQALRQIGSLQMDPVQVIARSHDLALHSRVLDYRPQYLDALLYRDRQFFDYGGALFIYPMEELPFWRAVMPRKGLEKRYTTFAMENPELLDEVRAEIRSRGPLGNRDLEGRTRVTSYRARKDSGLALYYLWLIGELMTHSRRGFERLYDVADNIVPPELRYDATIEEAESFFAHKTGSGFGLHSQREWGRGFRWYIMRPVDAAEIRRRIDELVAAGELAPIRVEGRKDVCYVPGADVPLLGDLASGRIPQAWKPLGPTTDEEVVFLAPLESVSARGQAKSLFGFDYIWEIYKPAEKRRWGYYTLPILHGDRLVARIDPKLDRKSGTLIVNGLWLEDDQPADDDAFIAALGKGLDHFAHFHEAQQMDLSRVEPAALRRSLHAASSVV